MSFQLIGSLSILCYFSAMILAIYFKLRKYIPSIILISILGFALHLWVLWDLVILHWVNLDFVHALSFASAWVLFSLFLTFRWYSVASLLVIILPIAAISLSLEISFSVINRHQASLYLDTHILLSILAYSFLCIAAILTLILFIQSRLLKRKNLTGWLQSFPPLAEVEITLFKTLWLGFSLLSLALISGFMFIDDLFSAKFAHKTFFSILSWLVFAILLFGRFRYGWRGRLVTHLTIFGFILVLLAYFGSKIVREILLKG